MTLPEQTDFILKTFKTIKHLEQQRYRKGQSIREFITQKQRNGEEVDHYRIDFLHESITKLFKFMEQIGVDFNREHPEDRFTVADMADILYNAMNIIDRKVH
jgi:hypothetical protein